MVRGDPGWAEQRHHVQTQRQEDAEQRDELEGPENVHLVHRHLLGAGRSRGSVERWGEIAGCPSASAPTIALTALCGSSWGSLLGDVRLERVFKIKARTEVQLFS